jgi:cobalt-zinc-cadmium efflux system membrane fusion protein
MNRLRTLGLSLSLAALPCLAHEGEVHHEEPAPPLSALDLAERPHLLADGSLYLPKQAQHLLDIRTQTWTGTSGLRRVALTAEVQAQPAAAVAFTAAEPGHLEAAESAAWPLPGQTVRAGQLLAWLRPLQNQRDAARRRAQVAELDQKLIIANLNVGRLQLQGAVNADSGSSTGNIYLEDAKAERDSLQRQRDVIALSLVERMPLRAPVTGRVLTAAARSGDVVAAGQLLFQFDDPMRLRLSALIFDPVLGASLSAASLRMPDGDVTELAYRGQEPLANGQGWRLLFDLADGDDLSPGQVVVLDAEATGKPAVPSGACAIDAAGAPTVWIHRAAERFVPRRIASCASIDDLAVGERLVVRGSALLSQFH